MAFKINYSECKSAGLGLCWFCENKTNFILNVESEQIFCCFCCALFNYKSSKIIRKVRTLERMRKGENSKILHGKKSQNAMRGVVL